MARPTAFTYAEKEAAINYVRSLPPLGIAPGSVKVMGVLVPPPPTVAFGMPEAELDAAFERLFWAEGDEDIRLLLLRIQADDYRELGL